MGNHSPSLVSHSRWPLRETASGRLAIGHWDRLRENDPNMETTKEPDVKPKGSMHDNMKHFLLHFNHAAHLEKSSYF